MIHSKHTMLICIFLFLATSCKKEITIHADIIGTWKWIITRSPNPFFPEITPFTTGNQKKLQFASNGTFFYFENDTLKNQGMFQIKKVVNPINAYEYFLLSNDKNIYPFIIKSDSLIIDYNLTGLIGSGQTIYLRTN